MVAGTGFPIKDSTFFKKTEPDLCIILSQVATTGDKRLYSVKNRKPVNQKKQVLSI
jgi:hypothetical protein